MPEDAPGNPGAVPGSPAGGRPVMYGKVREMQAKLHRWAGQDQSRRFGDLFVSLRKSCEGAPASTRS